MPSPSTETRKTSRLPTPAQQFQLAKGRQAKWLRNTASISLVACVLLLRNTYIGIWHDSILYFGQMLSILYPEPFQHDLFFAYGSQANFTVFPQLLAWLCAWIAPDEAFLWLTLAGLGAFGFASWQLIRRIMPTALRYPALIAVACLPGAYGAWDILSYAEPFLTGRTFAEPLVLLSLGGLLARRYWLAGIAGCMAAALHPLQALPALVITWIWLVQGDRRWLHLVWAILPLAACLLLPRMEFALLRMDPVWYAQVLQRNFIVFYSNSGPEDWYYLLTDIFLGSVATHLSRGPLRRYLIALLTSSVLLFAASLLLADVWHFAWVTGLQLWRVHWILHWSAMAVLPWLCHQLWNREQGIWRPRLGIFIATVLFGCTPTQAHPLLPGTVLLFIAWPWLARHLTTTLQVAISVSVLIVGVSHLVEVFGLPQRWGFWLPLTQWPSPFLRSLLPIFATVMIFVAPWLWTRADQLAKSTLAAAAFLAFLAAALTWDQRPPLNRSFTSNAFGDRPFGARLPIDSQIEWIDGLTSVWGLLHRSHYVEYHQLSGIVFNRSTSLEGYRRAAQLHVQDAQGRDCPIVVLQHGSTTACRPDDFAVRQACKNTGGELDYFVLPYPLKSKPTGTWSPPGSKKAAFYLYACQELIGTPKPMTVKQPAESSR